MCLAIGVILPLCGCGSGTGDFGRVQTGYATGTFWPLFTQAALAYRDEPESWGATTDDERDLRNRAWRFLTPQFSRSKFHDLLAELRVERILPASADADREAYLSLLLSDAAFRSLASRYRRLSEDIEADRLLIGDFRALYLRVKEADRIRERSFAYVQDLTPGEKEDALARIQENKMLEQWVQRDLCLRIDRYRFALERLVLMGPMREAIYAEQGLKALSAECPLVTVAPIAIHALRPKYTK